MIRSIPKAEFEKIIEKSKEETRKVTITMNDAISLMKPCAIKLFQSFPAMYSQMEINDFINECVYHFLDKKYLERFDGRTSPIYFLFVGMKHRLIDILRHSNHLPKMVSDEIRCSTKDEMDLTIYDVVADKDSFDPIGEMVVEEALEILSRVDPLNKVFETKDFGTVRFCQYYVFKMHLKGYDRKSISEIFGVTTATVGNYIKAAQEKLSQWYAE